MCAIKHEEFIKTADLSDIHGKATLEYLNYVKKLKLNTNIRNNISDTIITSLEIDLTITRDEEEEEEKTLLKTKTYIKPNESMDLSIDVKGASTTSHYDGMRWSIVDARGIRP